MSNSHPTSELIQTIDLSRRPALLKELDKDIEWLQKELDDNPGHPTNLYVGKELNKKLIEREKYLPTNT